MRKIIQYKYTIVVALAIIYVSLMKPPSLKIDITKIPNIDKIVHLIMYATLSVVMAKETQIKKIAEQLLIIFAITTIFGGVIEILQQYFPPRTASWGDFLADAIGSALPLACITIYKLTSYDRQQKREPNNKEDSNKPS